MAYFSDESLERVKASIDLVELVGSYLPLKKSGKNYLALCPFHSEKTPSFTVNPELGMFKCFGCGEGGDGIRFIEKMEGMDFVSAVRFLADRYGVPLEEEGGDPVKEEHRRLLFEINREAMIFFYHQLLTQSLPQRYLKERGMDASVINPFFLGYADGRGDSLYRHLREKGYSDESLLELGLVSPSNRGTGFYDRFRNRLIFPIINTSNKIIGFGGRIIGNGQPKYLNSPESEIFHKRENLYSLNLAKKSRSDRLILVEGYMDVVSLHYYGVDYAVASLGTSLTGEQATLINRYKKQVYLCYDGDSAGIQASRRAIAIFQAADIHPRMVALPEGKDPDEYLRAYGREAFEGQLDKAIEPLQFELNILSAGFDLGTSQGKIDYLRRATDFLAAVGSAAEEEIYTKKVAEQLGIEAESLAKDVAVRKEKLGEERRKDSHPAAGSGFSYQEEADFYGDPYLPETDPSNFPAFGGRSRDLGMDNSRQHGLKRKELEYQLFRASALSASSYELLKEEEAFIEDPAISSLYQSLSRLWGEGVLPSAEVLKGICSNPREKEVVLRLGEDEKRRERLEEGVAGFSSSQQEEKQIEDLSRELLHRIRLCRLEDRRKELRQTLAAMGDGPDSRGKRADILKELRELEASLRTIKGGKD